MVSIYSQTIIVCSIIIAAAFAYYFPSIARISTVMGFGRKIDQLNTEGCNIVFPKKLIGCEDVHPLSLNGSPSLILACSQDLKYRLKWYPPVPVENRNISGLIRDNFYIYDVNKEEVTKLKLSNFPKEDDLVLHAFDIAAGSERDTFMLYAINHKRQGSGSVIEKFSFKAGSDVLTHLATFDGNEGGLLTTPNTVTIIDQESDSFYASNDHYYKHNGLHDVETFLLRPWSHLTFHSKANGFKIAQDGLVYATGTAKVGDKLLVAEGTLGEVSVYNTNSDNSVSLFKKIIFDFLIDNIIVSSDDGFVYVAGHLSVDRLGHHMTNPKKTAPSAVARVSVADILSKEITTPVPELVFSDNTGLVNASTAGVVQNKVMFVTAPFSRGLLRCDN